MELLKIYIVLFILSMHLLIPYEIARYCFENFDEIRARIYLVTVLIFTAGSFAIICCTWCKHD